MVTVSPLASFTVNEAVPTLTTVPLTAPALRPRPGAPLALGPRPLKPPGPPLAFGWKAALPFWVLAVEVLEAARFPTAKPTPPTAISAEMPSRTPTELERLGGIA